MDLHKVLLFLLATIVALGGRLRTFVEQFIHIKDLLFHYAWLFLHKFLPKRRFVLDRLPRHVAFSIADYSKDLDDTSEPAVSLPDLARLVVWCGRYGIEKVSIYDWMGVVAKPANTEKLSELVWTYISDKETGLEDVRLRVNGSSYLKAEQKTTNGNASKTLELVTLDWKAGRRAIVQASRAFGADVRSGRLDVGSKSNDFGAALNDYLSSECCVTAPDLLIEFAAGNVGDSTCGYPPLALRVVEILQVPRHRGIDELAFLECLEKYSQRDRRFGK